MLTKFSARAIIEKTAKRETMEAEAQKSPHYSMVRLGLKNFWVNLKYFFTPLGTLFLGLIIGLSIAVPTSVSAVGELIDEINKLAETELNTKALTDEISKIIFSLDWNNPSECFALFFDTEWLIDSITECLNALIGTSVDVEAEIVLELITNSALSVFVGAVGILTFGILGMVAGYYILAIFVRREMAKRALWKRFLLALAESIINSLVALFFLFITSLWRQGGILFLILALIIYGLTALFEAYLVHGLKKVQLKHIVTLVNIGKLFLTNILIFAISIAVAWLASVIVNTVTGIVVGLAILEIAVLVVNLNAEAFVKTAAEQTAVESQTPQPARPEPDEPVEAVQTPPTEIANPPSQAQQAESNQAAE